MLGGQTASCWLESPMLGAIVVPDHDQQACSGAMIEHLHTEHRLHNASHQIVVLSDDRKDRTWEDIVTPEKTSSSIVADMKCCTKGFGTPIVIAAFC